MQALTKPVRASAPRIELYGSEVTPFTPSKPTHDPNSKKWTDRFLALVETFNGGNRLMTPADFDPSAKVPFMDTYQQFNSDGTTFTRVVNNIQFDNPLVLADGFSKGNGLFDSFYTDDQYYNTSFPGQFNFPEGPRPGDFLLQFVGFVNPNFANVFQSQFLPALDKLAAERIGFDFGDNTYDGGNVQVYNLMPSAATGVDNTMPNASLVFIQN
jgi:hypothetical protein